MGLKTQKGAIMEAKLNIYQDCTSAEPTKTYICRRLTYGAGKKIDELSVKIAKLEKKRESETDEAKLQTLTEEQFNLNLEVIRVLFPEFKDEEFNGIDVFEYQEFMNEVANEKQRILEKASKN